MPITTNMKFYRYRANITRVVDGDTFYADLDLGFGISCTQVFRLSGIDTPEIYRPESIEELELGRDAKEFVEEAVLGKEVTLVTYKTGKYGRWIATVILDEDDSGVRTTLTQLLKENGYAKDQV